MHADIQDDIASELELCKEAFGRAWAASPDNVLHAAMRVFPDNMAFALIACREWTADEAVLKAYTDATKQSYPPPVLPTKEQLAKRLLDMADEQTQNGKYANDMKDRVLASRLAAEILDYLPKPGSTNLQVNQDNRTVVNPVMIMPAPNENWEEKLLLQQTKLLENVSKNS